MGHLVFYLHIILQIIGIFGPQLKCNGNSLIIILQLSIIYIYFLDEFALLHATHCTKHGKHVLIPFFPTVLFSSYKTLVSASRRLNCLLGCLGLRKRGASGSWLGRYEMYCLKSLPWLKNQLTSRNGVIPELPTSV